jgi:ATP-binding protein involved in chromosome partitioning
MASFQEKDILRALQRVIDPDLHRDIVSLGMVEDIKIEGNDVSFTLVLTTPACPIKEQMQAACQEAAGSIAGVDRVMVEVISRVPANRVGANRLPIVGVRNTIAVGSGKGGVGKSTVAVNLALALVQDGARVGLLDADIYGPNVPLMLNITAKPEPINGKILPVEKYGLKVMSMGFFVDAESPVMWRGPMLSKMLQQFLYDVEWGEIDYLVMDLPPGTGDVQITLAQNMPLTGAVIVSTPQEVALMDATRALNMFVKLDVPILGMVENMSYFIAPNGDKLAIFGHGGAKAAAEKLEVPFLGEVPLDQRIREGSDDGHPIVLTDEMGANSAAFHHISRGLAAQVSILALNG